MKLGILTAMPEELTMLQSHLTEVQKTTIGERDYFTGHLFNNHDVTVTLVFSRWGKVAAASTTSTLIHVFGIDQLLFTGVAASINSQVKRGDVVIASQLYQHDMDARPLLEKYEIPLTGKKFFDTDEKLSSSSLAAAQLYLLELGQKREELKSVWHAFDKFKIATPKVHHGIIATGDKFIRSQQQQDDILELLGDNTSKVFAVEMEGAAVAQVCDEHRLPFTIIRTISDHGDHDAVVDFAEFVSDVAKHYSYEIIKRVFAQSLRR